MNEWRWERIAARAFYLGQWSEWTRNENAAKELAKDPHYGTGRMQQRVYTPNTLAIEIIQTP